MANENALFAVDGKGYTIDDLTFREQRELRRLARELVGDPEAEIPQMDLMDVVPVAIYLVRHRDDDSYTLEQALDLKWTDISPDAVDEGASRPTKRRAKTT